MMYKPDDEKLEQSVEEAGVLQEKDINEPEAPIETAQEAPAEDQTAEVIE